MSRQSPKCSGELQFVVVLASENTQRGQYQRAGMRPGAAHQFLKGSTMPPFMSPSKGFEPIITYRGADSSHPRRSVLRSI